MRMLAQTGLADIFLDERGVVKRWRHPGDLLARARTVMQVAHPHLVAVREVGLDGAHSFYVMEYVDGGTLGDRRGERMADDEVARLIGSLASALAALHAVGFVHGAVSPEHVFGAAWKLGGYDAGMGPPWYLAPEQWDEDAVAQPPADIYALGCILFECATGGTPFDGDSANRLRELHTTAHPPSLDGPLGDLYAAMLAKDAADRPTAADVVAATAI